MDIFRVVDHEKTSSQGQKTFHESPNTSPDTLGNMGPEFVNTTDTK